MKKIVMFDDDSSLTNLAEYVFTSAGYSIHTSNDPQYLKEVILEHEPDLILMDIVMPNIDGAEAVKILQADDKMKHIPVIFLTALISGKEEELKDLGIKVSGHKYAVMSKPFDIYKLVEKVKQMIGA